jgi:hypothetical protein
LREHAAGAINELEFAVRVRPFEGGGELGLDDREIGSGGDIEGRLGVQTTDKNERNQT